MSSPESEKQYSLLVISSELSFQQFVRQALSLFPNIYLFFADNPLDGRALAAEGHPDLVISDAEFLGHDQKACEAFFRATKSICPESKFIICSKVSDEALRFRYLHEWGAAAYLLKPLPLDTLILTVLDLIEMPSPSWLPDWFKRNS